jgi:hypothetical protein
MGGIYPIDSLIVNLSNKRSVIFMSTVRDPRLVIVEAELTAGIEVLQKTAHTVDPIDEKLTVAHDTIHQLFKDELVIRDEAINAHKEMKRLEAAAPTLENLKAMSDISNRFHALTSAQTKRFTAAKPKLNLPRVPSYTEVFGPALAEFEVRKAAAFKACPFEATINKLVQPIDLFIASSKRNLEVVLVDFKQSTLDYRNKLVQLGRDNLDSATKLSDAVLKRSAELRKIGTTSAPMPALSEKEQQAIAAEVFAKAAAHSLPTEEKKPVVVKKPDIILPKIDMLLPDITPFMHRSDRTSSGSDSEEGKSYSSGTSSPGSSPDHSPPGSPVKTPSTPPRPMVYTPAPHAQLFNTRTMHVTGTEAARDIVASITPPTMNTYR